MARLHYSFLTGDYSPDVIAEWQQDGCLDELTGRLGYRFVANEPEMPLQVTAGRSFTVRVKLHNEGFAAPFNARPPFLVLQGSRRFECPLDSDPRTWHDSVEIVDRIALPAGTSGSYSVALWLPDAADVLRAGADYAIRLPVAEWDESTGLNILGTVEVAPAPL